MKVKTTPDVRYLKGDTTADARFAVRAHDRYVALLHRKGYERLGSGGYGTAYRHPDRPHTVIKVGHAGLRSRDGYLDYLNWLRDAGVPEVLRKHFPTVQRLHVNRQFYVVELESLLENSEEEGNRISSRDVWLMEEGNLLREATGLIADTFRDSHCVDMHSGNFMHREDGTIVITDPLAERYL